MYRGPTTKPVNGKWLEIYRSHLLDREYMGGIDRDAVRVKANAEIFTPATMVEELVGRVGMETICDSRKRIIDPACGDGQFLAYILYCRLRAGIPLVAALDTLYGIEREVDNHKVCQARLRCGHDDRNGEVHKTVRRNILKRDTLSYDFSFGNKKSSADFQVQGDWVSGAMPKE